MAIPSFTPYGERQPLQGKYGYYQENPWTDPTGGQGADFLSRKPQLSAQDILSRGEGYAAKVGNMGQDWRQFGPNDPMIGQFQRNIMGGLRNSMDQYAGQAANAGVASSRGGYGVAGGSPQAAMLSRQGTQAIAGQYPQIYGQAAGLTKQSVDVSNQKLQMMIPLIAQMYGVGLGEAAKMASSIYGTDINAGLQLTGMAANSRDAYHRAAASAYGSDADTYNSALMGDYGRRQQILGDQEARTQRQRAADQQGDLMTKLKRGLTPWGLTNNPQWDEGYGMVNVGDYMNKYGRGLQGAYV